MSSMYKQSDILETDDRMIGAFAVGLVFILATAGAVAFVAQNTAFFQTSGFGEFLIQLFLAFLFLFILGIAANYKGLDVVQDHTFPIIKWSYLISIGLLLTMLVLMGGVLIPVGIPFTIILWLIAAVIAFFFYRGWPFILERIRLAAEWIKISATIVLNEPGMIVLSFIQSVVIGITIVTEGFVLIAWNFYAQSANVSQDISDVVVYSIMFLYLWLGLSVIYYFDGANTAMAYTRIHGRDPTIGQGINAASSKSLAIMGYALLTAILTVITRLLFFAGRQQVREAKSIQAAILGIVMQVIGGLVQILYHLMSFFTLPSIIIRRNSTIGAMQESRSLFVSTFWDKIFADMGYRYGANILYIVTGLILSVGGFVYGYFLAYIYIDIENAQIIAGIIFAIISLLFGIFISRFFLKPLYTTMVTTMYVYATEGPESLEIVPQVLKDYLDESYHGDQYHPSPV